MGASKLIAERIFINSNALVGNGPTRFCCVRFGNVWNTNGSVGRIFEHQLKNKEQITITDKRMTRFFVNIKMPLIYVYLQVKGCMEGKPLFWIWELQNY